MKHEIKNTDKIILLLFKLKYLLLIISKTGIIPEASNKDTVGNKVT